ncbi:MAG: IMP dehydrogenase, partial [Thermoplasmataceae archaeon]
MFKDKFTTIKEGYTFDDVLLLPSKTSVEPKEVEIFSKVSRNINVRIPIVSSPMDTVTESEMAIAIARFGGIGIVHRNMTVNEQSRIIVKVKRSESTIIRNVLTVSPETSLTEVRSILKAKNVSGFPVVSGEKLVGILTKRDLEFAGKSTRFVSEVMVKDVVSAPDNIGIEEAREILYKNRIEKLPLVDKGRRVVGLITAKDIVTREKFPDATRDSKGQLMVGAAVGPFDIERALTMEKIGADLIVVDTAHAHNENVLNSLKKMRKDVSIDIVAGNIATT